MDKQTDNTSGQYVGSWGVQKIALAKSNAEKLVIFKPQNKIITFQNIDGEQVGKLTIEKQQICFEGNADESAKIFLNCLSKHYRDLLKNGG